jgi:hypothetical protein
MFFDQFIAKIARKAATPVLGAVDDVVKDAAGLVGKAGGYVVDKLSDAKGAVADYYYDQKNDKTPTDLTSIKGITSAAQKAISVNVLEDVKKGVDVAQKTGDILLRLAVAAEEKVISPAITRPISTLGLVTDVSSPLYAPGKYEQGFQLADIRRAYNRSEEISLGVSLTQSDLIPGFKGFSDKVLNAGGIDIANINLWDDQNVQKNFSDNVVGRYFTGLTDFVGANAALLGVGKVISTAGRAASRSAGLSARGTTLAKFEQDANDGILNIVTNGERGRFTNTAQEINQVAESTDINLIFDFVKKYSNNERLIPLLQDTTDPAMVRDFLLADKGYLPALERLAKSAPDDLAELADLPGYIRSRNLLNDDVYQPTAEALPRIKSAFESSIKKNPENSKIYDAFLDPEGNILSMGKTGVFPIEPKFATAKISGAITGSRAAKAQVRTRDFSGMGYISERTISNRAGGLTASLVKFGGTHKPLGFVTFSGARPFDGIVELNAAFDDIKLFSNGSNLIKIGRNEAITAAEYRSKVLADFTSAPNPAARRKVLDDLDSVIIHDIARSYEFYDSKIIGELQQIMRQRANRATEQFGRNGFGMDATGRGIFTDAQTQSQIAESYRMSPLRDIEREILRAQKGTLAGKFDSTSAGLNNIYETLTKYWTFDVLARPSYIMKQSWLEPILSSGISQGTKYVFDQVPSMTKNILKNNRNRIKGIAFNTVNAKQAKEVGDVVDSITKQLSEAVQQRELLSAEAYKYFETDLVSPKMRKDYGDIVKAELKRADKLVEDLEMELQDAAAVFGGAEEIPSIATLERRIAYIESTQGKIDDIVPGVNPAKITEIDEENFVRAANPNIYNTGYVGLVDVNFVKRFMEFDRTKDVGKGGSGIPGWSAEQIAKITDDLKQGKGFNNHLILDYWLDEDGKLLLKLVEGNHRIQAAIAAGIDSVPVRFMRGSLSRVDEAKPTGIKSKILPDKTGYVPGQVFPGDILPDEFVKTARQAAQNEIDAIVAPVLTTDTSIISTLNSQRAKGFTAESNPDELESLIDYTNGSGNYSIVNTLLRGKDDGFLLRETAKAKKITSDLDSLIKKAPGLDAPITTFRGIADTELATKLRNIKPGETFTDKAFSSTSLTKATAERIARGTGWYADPKNGPMRGIVLQIANPAGTKGIFPLGFRTEVDKKLALSPNSEQEFLLPRNTKFTVTSVEGDVIKVTLSKPLDKRALFRAKNAAAIVNAKAAINKAKGELNTLIPDAAALAAVNDEIAELYSKIDDVILKDLGKSKLEQAKLFERSADFKKRYYGKGSSYQFIGNQYVKIDELFDENQLGAALREEFANSRSVATTFAGELTVGTKNSILLRRGPRTITDVRDPLYFEELAYVANRTLRNDPLVKLVLQERSLEDIMDWALSTPGQKYFSQFGDFAEGQIPSMVRNRVGLVQRYLPDMRVRAMVLEREVTSIELQKILSEDLGRLSTLHPIDFDYDMVSEAVGAKGLAAVEAAADKAMGAVWSKLTSPENPIRWSFADKVFKDTVARKAQVLADQGVELTVSRMNALRAAATRESLQETEKTFYTIRRKNRALWASRVLTAFPAASLNAMYRYGRFAIKNPTRMAGFLHNYQSTFRSFGVDEYGNPVDDPRKAKFLLIPGTKELGFNDGKGVMLNARSLGFLVNLPAPSYISTIPMTVVYKNKPDAEETFRNILGPTYDAIFPYGAPTNVLSPLMPAWAKDLYKSITGPEGDAQFMATVKSVANYHNALSDMGLKEKLTQEQIFNEARGLYFQRFRAGFASPFGVPYKVETNPMGLFDSYYNILVTKYINKNMNRSDAMDAADMEFLATVAPNFPVDRVSYRGSTAVTYVPATAEGYKRIWKENGKLIDSIGAIGKDGSMIGLLTLDIDATKEDTSLSIYNFLKNPATRLPDGSPLNKYALSPEKEEQRRQINRVWEKYTDLRDRLDAAAQERFKKPLRRIPELSKALSDYADTELKAESLDWWKEKKGQLAGGADNSFNYARALYEITNDKQFMKKYGDSPVWQDAQKFTQIRNAITLAYQSLPTGDPRKSRLKESYLDYIAANLGTFHPKVQEIMKRYFDDDTMKVVTD